MIRPGSESVAVCVDSIVLPSGSLALISFYIITGAILGVACPARCIFAPESAISRTSVLAGLGGVLILIQRQCYYNG